MHREGSTTFEQSSEEIWAAVAHFVRGAIATARIDVAAVVGIGFDATCCTVTCKWTYLAHENSWDENYFRQISLAELASDGRAFRRESFKQVVAKSGRYALR